VAGRLAKLLVLGPLREQLGLTRLSRAIVDGPPPSQESRQFFAALGLTLVRAGESSSADAAHDGALAQHAAAIAAHPAAPGE
jgi:hypothetical protein